MDNIDQVFRGYLKDISNGMIDEQSSYDKQLKNIDEQFLRYGLTNEQMATLLSEINGKATQYITQYANASALELVRLQINQPLLEAEILLKEKELELKDKDLLIKDKELAIKEQELALAEKELEIKEKELVKIDAEVILITNQAATELQKARLIQAQTMTEAYQQSLIEVQTRLVNRQVDGYGDNLLVKAAEFQGGLASFAVNSGSDTANSAIANFNQSVAMLITRSNY